MRLMRYFISQSISGLERNQNLFSKDFSEKYHTFRIQETLFQVVEVKTASIVTVMYYGAFAYYLGESDFKKLQDDMKSRKEN